MIDFIGVKVTSLGVFGLVFAALWAPSSPAAQPARAKSIKSLIYLTEKYTSQEASFKAARNLVFDQLTNLNRAAIQSGRMVKVEVETIANVEGFEHLQPELICGELARRLMMTSTHFPSDGPAAENIWQLKDRIQAELVFIVMNSGGEIERALGRSAFSCDGTTSTLHNKNDAPFVFLDRPRLDVLANFWDN